MGTLITHQGTQQARRNRRDRCGRGGEHLFYDLSRLCPAPAAVRPPTSQPRAAAIAERCAWPSTRPTLGQCRSRARTPAQRPHWHPTPTAPGCTAATPAPAAAPAWPTAAATTDG